MKKWNGSMERCACVPVERRVERGTAQSKHWRGFRLERHMERSRIPALERSTHSLKSGTVERAERFKGSGHG